MEFLITLETLEGYQDCILVQDSYYWGAIDQAFATRNIAKSWIITQVEVDSEICDTPRYNIDLDKCCWTGRDWANGIYDRFIRRLIDDHSVQDF